MTHLTLPSGEWLLVNTRQRVRIMGNKLVWGSERFGLFSKPLPPGSYQLHGSDPLNLTEEEAGDVVGKHNGLYEYPDYQNSELCLLSSTLESYSSLLAANGHKPGECVTLKKVK